MSTTPATVTSFGVELSNGQKKENARVNQPPTAESGAKTKPPTHETAKPKPKPKPTPTVAARPTKFLPSERIAFPKQLDILRGWAAASGPLRKPVTNNDVAEIVKMQPSTVSMANAFFSSIGLLLKTESGYVPSEEVTAFLRAYEWSPDTASQKLAPVISKSWFAEGLLSKLAFGPLTEDECVQHLADAAKAAPDYRVNLRILLEYLTAAGLTQKDGNMVKKGTVNMTATTAAASTNDPTASPTPKQDSQSPDLAKTMPSLFGTTEGKVQFNIAVTVGMGEFANWQADRITSFFGGIAQVLAAKAKVEKAE